MGYIVRMPQMGMSMEEGVVVEWTINEGESAEEGDTIVIVESEKAANDVEAREDGVLQRIHVTEGTTVGPGDPIGIFAGADEDISDLEAELEDSLGLSEEQDDVAGTSQATSKSTSSSADTTERASNVRATPGAKALASEEGVDLTKVEGTGPQDAIIEEDVEAYLESSDQSGDIRATPGAKALASEKNVDLTDVEGTGPRDAIIEDDVEAYLETSDTTRGGAPRTVSESRQLAGMQGTISERLSKSYREAVHVTLDRSFETDGLTDVLAAAEAASIDVSLNDLLIKTVGVALGEHPALNAIYEDGNHDLIEEVNIGVAVDVEAGLVTPVIPDVENKTVENINETRSDLTERALSGEYTPEVLSGGTFTISNLGMFGIDDFNPIINPPEVAILGVGRIRGDETMTLSLSFDHRVVNGADAARFLDTVVTLLTDVTALERLFGTDLSIEPALDDRNVRVKTASGLAGRYRTAFGGVSFDEPEDIGGGGTAPSPVDHLLGALGSCLSLSVRQMAERDGVDIGEIRSDVTGAPQQGPIESVAIALELETDAEPDAVDTVVAKAERACYVARSLSDDVSVSHEWSRL